jgi:hypothetical protein
LKSLLPEARAIFEEKPKSAQLLKETWDAARVVLIEGNQTAQAQLEAAQQMAPEILLLKIEDRLARLENTFMQLSDAISTMEKGKEEALGRTLYAVAQKQKETAMPSAEEGAVEEKVAEPATIEEAAREDPTQAGTLGHKEAADESGRDIS